MTNDDDTTTTAHHIGEVADLVGLSHRTIRHYDSVGLVPPSGRSSGGFRLYTDADLERLRLVKHLKPLNFSLAEMQELLDTRDLLLAGVPDEEATDLRGRLAIFAAIANERCELLREQLAHAEELATLLSDEALEPRRVVATRGSGSTIVP